MKKIKLTKTILAVLLATVINSAGAQNNLRALIQGENGLTATDTRLTAEQQITFNPSQVKSIFGLDKNSDLVLKRTETDNIGFVHYRYFQTFQNIPVENSMYIVHTKNGKLTGMSGSVILDFDKQMSNRSGMSLTSENAITAALNYVHAKTYTWQDADAEQGLKNQMANVNATYYPTSTLVWYSTGDEINTTALQLCYKVDVYALQPLSRAYYFVDAKTGKVIGTKDELFYSDATGTCNTAYSGTQTIHSDLFNGSYRLRDLTKGNGVVTLHSTSGHTDYTNASSTWSLSGADQYALDAHYGVSQTWSFYNSNFGRNSVDNAGFVLTSYVNETATVNNAYWDGSIMHFGVRSGTNAGIDAIDVTGHELTHGVTQYTSGLNYSNQSGAMNESMSDIFGKSVQFWSKPNDINWLMSNDMNWNIRNMSNPNQFSQPDTYLGTFWYTGTADNGGVHTNSGVGNFMFYLLTNGGSGTNDIGNAYTVSGLGLTKADAIIYRSETVYLTATSQYTNWRSACISSATDLYGAGSNEVTQVMNAWYAVGIGSAGGGSGCSAPTGLNANTITTSTATLNWAAAAGATSYNLQYRQTGTTTWTPTTSATTSVAISGLIFSTQYEFQVQTVCSSGTSSYSTPVNFTTTAPACSDTHEPNNTRGTASVVPVNTVQVGLITPSGDADCFKITTVAPNTNLQITLSNLPADYEMYLKNNSGTNLVTSTNGGLTNELIKYNTATAATYVIRIFGYSGANNASQCYNLNIQASSTPFRISENENSVVADETSALKVYPNPASDVLNLEFNTVADGTISITIFDVVGKTVLSSQKTATSGINNFAVSLKDVSRGVYFVEVNNGVEKEIKKIIVSK